MKPKQIIVCLMLLIFPYIVLGNENFSIKNLISIKSGEVTTITLDCFKDSKGQDFTCEPIVYSFKNSPNHDLDKNHDDWLKWAKNNEHEAKRRIHDSLICDEIRKELREVKNRIGESSALNKQILTLRAKQCESASIERAIEIHQLEKKRNQNSCQVRGPAILAKWTFTKSSNNRWTSTYLSSCGYTYVYVLAKDKENHTWTLNQTIVGDKDVEESEFCKVEEREKIFEQKQVFSWRDMPQHVKCEYMDFVNY